MNRDSWKALVVEDETDAMELLRGILEYHGIKSIDATNGEEALVLLQQEIPTVMIIDLATAGIDGWGLLAKLKDNQQFCSVPRIAITAYHTAEVANQAIESGFDAYFSKPLDPMSFARELESIINA